MVPAPQNKLFSQLSTPRPPGGESVWPRGTCISDLSAGWMGIEDRSEEPRADGREFGQNLEIPGV